MPMQPPMQPQVQPPKPKPGAERIVILVALGFVVLLVLAGGAYWYFNQGAEPQKVVGTAEVVSSKSAIYEGYSGSAAAKVVQPLAQGDKVNIVRLPRSTELPKWIAVQYVNGKKVSEPGFARTSDLGNWSSFSLLSLFRPDDSAGANEIAEYVKSLDRLAAQAKPEEKDRIFLDTANESLTMARLARASGTRPDAWIERTNGALNKIGDDSDLRSQRDELRQALKTFR